MSMINIGQASGSYLPPGLVAVLCRKALRRRRRSAVSLLREALSLWSRRTPAGEALQLALRPSKNPQLRLQTARLLLTYACYLQRYGVETMWLSAADYALLREKHE